MVLDFRVECVIDMDRESYWKLKGSQPFFEFLVQDNALSKMEAVDRRIEPDGSCYLKCAYIPKTVAIPDILRGLLGETLLEVIDEQRWSSEEPYKVDFKVTPTFLSDQIKTYGVVEILEHEDPKKCVHVVQGKTEVNIYFIKYVSFETTRTYTLWIRLRSTNWRNSSYLLTVDSSKTRSTTT